MNMNREMPTTRNTSQDRIPPWHSTGEVVLPAEMIGDDRIPSQRRNGEERNLPDNKDVERDPPLSNNGRAQVPPNKQQIENRGLHKKISAGLCTFEETKSVTLFMKMN